MNLQMKPLYLALITMTVSLAGCGTTVGNPATVTVKNVPYDNNGVPPTALFMPSAMAEPGAISGSGLVAALAVTDFKFCNTQIKLENEGISSDGGESESRIGHVDASDPSIVTQWGNVIIPEGAFFNELSVELHFDPEVCGVGYSVRYEGVELTADLEFNFKFSTPILVTEGDAFALGMTAIATAFENARIAGKLNDVQITDYINETLEDEGTKE